MPGQNYPKHLSVPTDHGDAVAVKDSTSSPWEIQYPWKRAKRYGTTAGVRSAMTADIEKYYKSIGKEEEYP